MIFFAPENIPVEIIQGQTIVTLTLVSRSSLLKDSAKPNTPNLLFSNKLTDKEESNGYLAQYSVRELIPIIPAIEDTYNY
jgi:hypothetical protein